MAHFAEIRNGKVWNVIVVANENCLDENGNESEEVGKAFIASCGISGEYVQTSYNANIRGKYAAIGDIYDAVNDVFVAPTITEE